MSETELDLVSIATRVLQLEEEQVILKKYLAKLKRQLEAQEQRFNDRPEPILRTVFKQREYHRIGLTEG